MASPLLRATALVCAACAWLAPDEARAGGGAATDTYEGIDDRRWLDVHALADVYAQHVEAPGGLPRYRAFDLRSDQPALGLLHLGVAHRPDWLGFRVDAGVGDLADAYFRSDPAATDHRDVARGLSYLEQAFVSVELPVGHGLSLDAGKFGTPVGLEDNESASNWNYSRSLLFTLAEPSYHTGLRATVRATDALAFTGFWLNGWDTNVLDGNGMRSFALAATWEAGDVQVVAVYAAGLERAVTHLADPTLAFRHELDASVVYRLRSWLRFAATADYGIDARGGEAQWWGVGGYGRASVLPWLALVLRGEHYEDPQGFTSGTAQRIAEATATVEASTLVGPVTLIGRLEYRRDQSDEPVFAWGNGARITHQDSTTAAVIAAF